MSEFQKIFLNDIYFISGSYQTINADTKMHFWYGYNINVIHKPFLRPFLAFCRNKSIVSDATKTDSKST